MKTIWKFELPLYTWDVITVFMPAEAVPVHLATTSVSHHPCMWAEVDHSAEPVARQFRWFATGEEIPEIAQDYIGTVMESGGVLVWHLYELV